VLVLIRTTLWFVESRKIQDTDELNNYDREIELRVDSIRDLKTKIDKRDSITDFWGQLKKLNKFDISKANQRRLKSGALIGEQKTSVADSLEKSIKFVKHYFDSLSPDYDLEFRQELKDRERSLNEDLLERYVKYKDRNENYLKILEYLEAIVNVLTALTGLLIIYNLIKGR
jgi:hypothetical protein